MNPRETLIESSQVTLLLIEDDLDHRHLFQNHLRRCAGVCFTVETADRLAAGLEQLEQHTFDAVLLDLRLPDSSGLETLRRVRDCSAEVAVVVLSALNDQELAVQAVQEGAQDYLVKSDLSSELLSRAIRYAIERRRNETQLERLVEARTAQLVETNRRLEREIDEHKQARSRLARQQEKLLQAERLAAIGEMVTGLAHESRNALQRSQACLSMLSHRLEDAPEINDLLMRAQQAQDDLSRLYDQVRQYAAPIQLERTLCRLDTLALQAWEQLELNVKHRQACLAVSESPVDLACHVDRFAIVQVFRNLFENALDACPDPVEIHLLWNIDEADAQVTTTVRDNGPGFPPEHLNRLFQPFHTTKVRGTGLGLAITRRLVEAHGGDLSAENSASGAEITITLPRHGAAK